MQISPAEALKLRVEVLLGRGPAGVRIARGADAAAIRRLVEDERMEFLWNRLWVVEPRRGFTKEMCAADLPSCVLMALQPNVSHRLDVSKRKTRYANMLASTERFLKSLRDNQSLFQKSVPQSAVTDFERLLFSYRPELEETVISDFNTFSDRLDSMVEYLQAATRLCELIARQNRAVAGYRTNNEFNFFIRAMYMSIASWFPESRHPNLPSILTLLHCILENKDFPNIDVRERVKDSLRPLRAIQKKR